MHFPLSLGVLTIVSLAVARDDRCAVCPQKVVGPGNATYTFVMREIQPTNVVCGSAYYLDLTSRRSDFFPT
ncbi:hypothetical protein DFH07DRAFT_835149 [Mycena maculata]|uniref:Uncharacterized protein n=1 Tax=Mycena maculata TaxID=230809 RepID=A0AAD7N3F5_9AGAR|nr:hypothetical protein DFH07DRAFT_835149 [Mycena maculata]